MDRAKGVWQPDYLAMKQRSDEFNQKWAAELAKYETPMGYNLPYQLEQQMKTEMAW